MPTITVDLAPINHSASYEDYMTGRGTVNIAVKQLGDALFWRTA